MNNDKKMARGENLSYYSLPRNDLLLLLPPGKYTVLDIGCGDGATGRELKNRGWVKNIAGIENYAEAASFAARDYDKVYTEDAGRVILNSKYDLVICGDLLEHLTDPWQLLKKIYSVLEINGILLLSFPNVRNWKIILSLLLGRWEYRDAGGIMDKTHLRFFTLYEMKKNLLDAGFIVEKTKFDLGKKKAYHINKMTLGFFSDFLVLQHLVKCKKVIR